MGRAYDSRGERGKVHTGFWRRNLRGKDHWQDMRRWKDNIKTGLQRVGGGTDWIDLAQDREKCREAVNAVMNLRLP